MLKKTYPTMYYLKYSFLVFLILLNCRSISHEKILQKYNSIILETTPIMSQISQNYNPEDLKIARETEISSIIVHSTGKLKSKDFLESSIENKFMVHLLVDKNGNIYGDTNPTIYYYHLIPALDESTIHIAIEGEENEILKNPKQLKVVSNILIYLSENLSIPTNNHNINSKSGIFSHTQAKKKYGYFSELTDCGGENLMKTFLTEIGGKFYHEEEWFERFEKNWIARKEKINPHVKTNFDRGRSITIQEKISIDSLEKTDEGYTPEQFRLKYIFKEKIEPTCIVLHFTAIPSFKKSQEVLEMRKLSASIMVDSDGKAYQLLDFLEDMAQAASGTNDRCIQIEIVGKNTDDLMKNEIQSEKVAKLVTEISKKYKIEITNEKIESFNGVFSHTQAKKKFGGSAALIGKEFDPGEIYMEKIISKTGGKFYKEENWHDRQSENWVMIFKNFQP